ncbi:hypothetical protein KKF91_12855 [Myxococcota bacterium]|nr:hypothetical protein [Myxococcota bacterium]MBU1431424.1 hypothetical protein [Myxococcota bacterium]
MKETLLMLCLIMLFVYVESACANIIFLEDQKLIDYVESANLDLLNQKDLEYISQSKYSSYIYLEEALYRAFYCLDKDTCKYQLLNRLPNKNHVYLNYAMNRILEKINKKGNIEEEDYRFCSEWLLYAYMIGKRNGDIVGKNRPNFFGLLKKYDQIKLENTAKRSKLAQYYRYFDQISSDSPKIIDILMSLNIDMEVKRLLLSETINFNFDLKSERIYNLKKISMHTIFNPEINIDRNILIEHIKMMIKIAVSIDDNNFLKEIKDRLDDLELFNSSKEIRICKHVNADINEFNKCIYTYIGLNSEINLLKYYLKRAYLMQSWSNTFANMERYH